MRTKLILVTVTTLKLRQQYEVSTAMTVARIAIRTTPIPAFEARRKHQGLKVTTVAKRHQKQRQLRGWRPRTALSQDTKACTPVSLRPRPGLETVWGLVGCVLCARLAPQICRSPCRQPNEAGNMQNGPQLRLQLPVLAGLTPKSKAAAFCWQTHLIARQGRWGRAVRVELLSDVSCLRLACITTCY